MKYAIAVLLILAANLFSVYLDENHKYDYRYREVGCIIEMIVTAAALCILIIC